MIFFLLNTLSVLGQFSNYSQTNWNYGTQSQNVSLTFYNTYGWFVQIEVGYYPQYFMVQVDTGSNILWVAYSNCRNCEMTNRYYSSNEPYFQPTGRTFSEQYYYGDEQGWYNQYDEAECSGIIAQDYVGLAQSNTNSVPYLMLFATYESGFGASSQYSGIMGLSNNQSFINIFQQLQNDNEIQSQLYGLVLNQPPHESYLIYDEIDQNILDKAIWVTADDQNLWKFYINFFLINGKDYSDYMGSNNYGILDSGNTCLIVPAHLYNFIVQDLLQPVGCGDFGSTLYCPCWNPNNASYPNITIVLNQVTINIPYQNLFVDFYQSGPEDLCEVCLDILPSYENNFSFIFGGPMFLSVIPIFNKQTNQVGFYGGIQNDVPNSDEINENYIK